MESIADVLVVAIVFSAIFGGGIVKLILNHRKEVRALEISERNTMSQEEQESLKKQIGELKRRVEVLERIVTDSKYQLEKEIASL
ncbi:TPA: nitrite reductase [Vibrio parahaemolyticus]|uniref:nitrite reductase n=1 Tax=Vibrio parahaemolyticus TaxID=670 RepID=UPI0010CEEFF4|nr:nitrite reductase [Vibrio parahaemolyticus]MBE4090754.1 nitrite reductase [Vibrio parahaemolyticus]MBE4333181.1 nitrite reductase [Vibrio parahaemolyticus]MBE4355632.1 nitrite reductase [Vibrio parahaemolyticus]MBE5137889.1 nitrite reductase [Vibrio parahaemolyticus]MBE5165108.1 nitrite reductase [Vibrio parahaemolyticus]